MIFMCSREGLVGEPNWALPPSIWVGHQKYVVSTDRVKVKEGLWSFFGGGFFDIEPENGFDHQLGVLTPWEGAIYKYVVDMRNTHWTIARQVDVLVTIIYNG